MSANKKQKLSEPLVLQPRLAQITGDKVPMLTIAPESRNNQTKQEYLASLTEEAKDKIHAQAFRFLMAKIKECAGSDDMMSHLYELVGDVMEDPFPWSREEKLVVDEKVNRKGDMEKQIEILEQEISFYSNKAAEAMTSEGQVDETFRMEVEKRLEPLMKAKRELKTLSG